MIIQPPFRKLHSGSLSLIPAGFSKQVYKIDKKDSINRNLDAYWPLNGSSRVVQFSMSGGDALREYIDLTGANNASSFGTPPTLDMGLFGGCTVFNGTAHVSTTYVPQSTNFSFCGWVKSASSGVNNRPFGNGNNSNGLTGCGIVWGFPSSNQIYVACRRGGNIGTYDVTITPSNIATSWHHIAVVVDVNNGMTVFFDGVAAGNNSLTTFMSSGLDFEMGLDGNQSTGGLTGSVCEVRYWSRVINAAEVLRIYNDRTGKLGLKLTQASLNFFSIPLRKTYFFMMT